MLLRNRRGQAREASDGRAESGRLMVEVDVEPGAPEEAARLATPWFQRHLGARVLQASG